MAENKAKKNREYPITKSWVLGELLEKYPDAAYVMLKRGMQCVGCSVATWETLEQAAATHEIDVDELVKDLNKMIKSEGEGNENNTMSVRK